jgi:DNA transformation protein
MFGSWGIFHEGTMFAIVASGRLYLKADGETEARFTAAGLAPFTYQRQGRLVALSYREAPPEALDDPAVLRDWARLALEAAARVPRRKARRRRWPNSLP